jgi:hypothetical protein
LGVCFSPQADLVGGGIISAIGVDAMIHVRKRRSHRALAVLPLVLGAHQVIEAFVWWGQQHVVPHDVATVALWLYLLIAFVVLPVLVPSAVLALEPSGRRRWTMVPFVLLGTVVAGVLLAAMVRGPFSVTMRPYHLAYSLRLSHALVFVTLYVVAVCGALLLSGSRDVVLFGAVNLVAVIIIARLTVDGFASVWCGWAAVTSAGIALHMRFAKPRQAVPYALT